MESWEKSLPLDDEICSLHHNIRFDPRFTITHLIQDIQTCFPSVLIVWNPNFLTWYNIMYKPWCVGNHVKNYSVVFRFEHIAHILWDISTQEFVKESQWQLHSKASDRFSFCSIYYLSQSWLAYFGCTDMFPRKDPVNTNSLDYPDITHTVYQHQQLKWAALLRIWGQWPYRQDTASTSCKIVMTSRHENDVHITGLLLGEFVGYRCTPLTKYQ